MSSLSLSGLGFTGLSSGIDTNTIIANYNINDPGLGFQPRAYAPGYKIPERVLSYTASVQQRLPGEALLTVAYVGSQGRNLFLRGLSNLITNVATNPTTGAAIVTRQFGGRFAEIDYKTSGGNDHYNSLQTTINRRYAHGLTFGVQHTWGRSIEVSVMPMSCICLVLGSDLATMKNQGPSGDAFIEAVCRAR